MKHNQVPPPHSAVPRGSVIFNYSDHDGRLILGTGHWLFETKWSSASNSSIHVYNDPPSIRGVAIAEGCSDLAEVTQETIDRANFTSRTRTPKTGQIVLIENIHGRFLAIKIVKVLAVSHGSEVNLLEIGCRVLEEAGGTTGGISDLEATVGDVFSALDQAEEALRGLEPYPDPIEGTAGIGHNQPPPSAALSSSEYARVLTALAELREEIRQPAPHPEEINRQGDLVRSTSATIAKWVGRKLDLFTDELAKALGKNLASEKMLLTGWLLASGKLDQLAVALTSWLSSFG